MKFAIFLKVAYFLTVSIVFFVNNKNFRLNNLTTRAAMNAKVLVFVICVEAIIYLLLYNLHDCAFKCCIIKYNYVLEILFRIINSNDHRMDWTANILHTMQLPNLLWLIGLGNRIDERVSQFKSSYGQWNLWSLTHLFLTHHFSTPWKHQKTVRHSDVFKG